MRAREDCRFLSSPVGCLTRRRALADGSARVAPWPVGRPTGDAWLGPPGLGVRYPRRPATAPHPARAGRSGCAPFVGMRWGKDGRGNGVCLGFYSFDDVSDKAGLKMHSASRDAGPEFQRGHNNDASCPGITSVLESVVSPDVMASAEASPSDWLSENRAWIEAGGSGDLAPPINRLAVHLLRHISSREAQSATLHEQSSIRAQVWPRFPCGRLDTVRSTLLLCRAAPLFGPPCEPKRAGLRHRI